MSRQGYYDHSTKGKVYEKIRSCEEMKRFICIGCKLDFLDYCCTFWHCPICKQDKKYCLDCEYNNYFFGYKFSIREDYNKFRIIEMKCCSSLECILEASYQTIKAQENEKIERQKKEFLRLIPRKGGPFSSPIHTK